MGLFCQSCGMPFEISADFGTNADGSANEDYCIYCYQDGKFTSEHTLDEMIEICVPTVTAGNSDMDEDQARKMLKEFFPTLKRWKQD